jgi:hypothetical protein
MMCTIGGADCVPGLVEKASATCQTAPNNATFNGTSWSCETGYYAVPAPRFCARMYHNMCSQETTFALSYYTGVTLDMAACSVCARAIGPVAFVM